MLLTGVDLQKASTYGLFISKPVYWGPQITSLGCAPTPEAVLYVANKVTETVANADILATHQTDIVFPKNPHAVRAPLSGVYPCWNGCDFYWDQAFIDELVQRISVHVLQQRAMARGSSCRIAQILPHDGGKNIVLDEYTHFPVMYKTAEDFANTFGRSVALEMGGVEIDEEMFAGTEKQSYDRATVIGGGNFRLKMRPFNESQQPFALVDPGIFGDAGDGKVTMLPAHNPLPGKSFVEVHGYIAQKVNAALGEFYNTWTLGFTRIQMLDVGSSPGAGEFSVGEKEMLDICAARCVRKILSHAWNSHKLRAVYVMNEDGYSESFRTLEQAKCAANQVMQKVRSFERIAFGSSDFQGPPIIGTVPEISPTMVEAISEKASLMAAYVAAQRARSYLLGVEPRQTSAYVFASKEAGKLIYAIGTGKVHGEVVTMNPEPASCCLVQ